MSRRNLVFVVVGAHVSVLTLAVIFGGCVKGKKVPKLTSAAPVRELQAPEAMPEPILEPEGMVEETDLLVSREPEVIPPRVDAVLSPPPHATAVPREERRAKIAESKEEEIADLAAEKERALTAAAEKREKKIEALAEKKEKELSAHAERKERGPIVPSVKRREATSKASAARRRAGGGTHKVVPGDSLWKMSQRYGVSVAELARVNGLERDSVIRVGQVLVIPAPSATRMPSKEKKPVRKAVEKKAPVVVEKPAAGETSVASEEPVMEQAPVAPEKPAEEQAPVAPEKPVEEQAPVAPEEPVMEQAPVAVEESPVEKMPVATRESEIEVESEEEAPASVEEAETPSRETVEKARVPVAMKTHVVKRGETLSSIAKRYRVSLKKLVEVNKIDDPGRIRAGQSLVIPNSR